MYYKRMKLAEFLKRHIATSKSHYNFISLKPCATKYKVPTTEFWQLYDRVGVVQTPPLCLLEVPLKDFSVLRFDIDIYPTCPESEKTKLYDDNFIKDVVRHIHFCISDTAGKECDM